MGNFLSIMRNQVKYELSVYHPTRDRPSKGSKSMGMVDTNIEAFDYGIAINRFFVNAL